MPYGERLGSASKRSRKELPPAFPPSDGHASMGIATSSGADALAPGQEQFQLELAKLQKEVNCATAWVAAGARAAVPATTSSF